MFASVRRYQLGKDWDDEFTRQLQDGFIPLISDAPGFVAYYSVDIGNDEVISVSIFDTQEDAERSIELAADFVAKNLVHYLPLAPEVSTGEIRAHKS